MSLKFIIRKEEELCAVAKIILEKYNSKIFLFYGEIFNMVNDCLLKNSAT